MKKENYALALDICFDLLEGDEGDEMLSQYKSALEGIVKAEDDDVDGEGSSSSGDDDDTDDDSDSGSDDSEEEAELNSDEAEKKDDSIPRNNDDGEDATLPITLEEMFKEAKMPAEERERLQELRADFSSLRASVQDKNDAEESNWKSPLEGGAEAK